MEIKVEISSLVYIFLTIVTVGLGLFVKNNGYMEEDGYVNTRNGYTSRQQALNRVAEFAVFGLLTAVSACRIAVGNDYWPYRFNFRLIAQERHVSSEFGFNIIVRGMQQLFGYDNYLPVFALFSFITVLFFALALHMQAVDYALSLFLLMTGGYYFNSLNSVRYYLALAIALFAMKYVLSGEYLKFVLWIIAAGAFHKSVFLVIPAYIAAKILATCKLKKIHYVVGGAGLSAVLLFGKDIVREVIFYFYPYYKDSAFDNGQISYVNIMKCVAVIVLCVICYKTTLARDTASRFYFFLNIMGLVAYCCGSFIPEVSRVGYYLIVSQVFLIPRVLRTIEVKWFKKLCYVGVTASFTVYFAVLLKGMYAVDVRLLPYLNWIFN